jgi:hypothetical protein
MNRRRKAQPGPRRCAWANCPNQFNYVGDPPPGWFSFMTFVPKPTTDEIDDRFGFGGWLCPDHMLEFCKLTDTDLSRIPGLPKQS